MHQSLLSFCFVLCSSISPFIFSCAQAQYVPSSAVEEVTVRLWIEPNRIIPNSAILDGCRYWAPLGVRCVVVSLPEHANVRVRYSHETCLSSAARRKKAKDSGNPFADPLPLTPECRDKVKPKTDADVVTVGVCHPNGDIDIIVRCLKKTWPEIVRADGSYDPEHIVFIVAHEIGHALGLEHVPADCNDPCVGYQKNEVGGRVCGEAVMNPQVSEPKTLTLPDQQSFRLRDRKRP